MFDDGLLTQVSDPRENVDDLMRSLSFSVVPAQFHNALWRYFTERGNPGSFLMAVLQNNLDLAVREGGMAVRAGDLWAVVKWLQKHAPAGSWGSVEAVETWLTPAHHLTERE